MITIKARMGRKVSAGETWMLFHFPDSPANMITNAALDELSVQTVREAYIGILIYSIT